MCQKDIKKFGRGGTNFSQDFADIARSKSALGPWKLLHLNCQNTHPPTFPGTFSSKNLTYIYVGTFKNTCSLATNKLHSKRFARLT